MNELEQVRARKLAEMMQRAGKGVPSSQTRTLVNLTDSDFESTIHANKLVVVDCWAAWCYPCRLIAPVIEELSRKHSSAALFAKLNVDENPLTASKHYIQSIPTILVIQNGVEVERIVGAAPKEDIEAVLKKYLSL